MLNKGYRWIGVILVTLCSVFFAAYLLDNWSLLSMSFFSTNNITTLSIALILYLVCFSITSLAWYRLLLSTGQTPQIAQITAIILISQFAKYIPGNFSHHVGRAVLARRNGLSNQSIIITMAYEIVIVIVAAAVIGIAALILNSTLPTHSINNISKFALPLFMITMLLILVLVNRKIYNYIKAFFSQLLIPSRQTLFECYLLYTLSFLLFGVILSLIAWTYSGTEKTNFWFLTSSFSIAWILGFITPGAPAGLGIRETVLIALIAPIYGGGLALSLAVTLRMVTSLGDGLGFLLGLIIRTIKSNS
ncbi:lysylphosphatidylglycerol synthase domain-containing protein [Shewanella sp. MBTL60-112-B2]|uniref:lysylphosphatidylglycerol synthase domain-containing protein n=1 Tax=Shewanella sp. MBTL60-112-B2 TaxID=2815917 RepID=UPI001C7EA3F7|nr:lysylphosphatidylglycerol synthase domain-containing protein [Shewanella sp. MBTL60-112-B2]GIU40439.1 hypothetical protein TUM4445_39570 [Shewanella sp. MBTL60-112-B2]